MMNAIRSLTFATLLSLAVVPNLSAENMGTNPKPNPRPTVMLLVAQCAASLLFGI